jgi:hypothetical protein
VWDDAPMAANAGGRAIDRNVQLLIEDLSGLRKRLQEAPEEAQAAHISQLAAAYLLVNRPVLELAFAGWRQTPEDELKKLAAEHPRLDGTGAWHGFEEIAWHLVPLAPDILRGASVNLLRVSDDNLHMLLRVLEYAQYVADCSAATVRWHPLVANQDTDQIDRLRESLQPKH